ncbi:MAG TPA: peptidase M23, partial [Alistipes sp.]|nr:peptidase M23 [Alistipes sp.]
PPPHYELRETASGRRLNIVREGIVRPHDDLPPRILRLHYAEIDSLDGVCVRAPMQSYPILRTADGSYRPSRREAVEV